MKAAFDKRWKGCRCLAASTDEVASNQAFECGLDRVSAHRRRKALSYRFAKDRRTSLLAGLLLDELLGDYGLRERDMTYVEGELGKPLFAERPRLHFSLAHSENMAVASLSLVPVGADIEHLPSFPHEVAEPYSWTEMESVGKLLGCGVGTFIDSGEYRRPESVALEHVQIGEYLICIARQNVGIT